MQDVSLSIWPIDIVKYGIFGLCGGFQLGGGKIAGVPGVKSENFRTKFLVNFMTLLGHFCQLVMARRSGVAL